MQSVLNTKLYVLFIKFFFLGKCIQNLKYLTDNLQKNCSEASTLLMNGVFRTAYSHKYLSLSDSEHTHLSYLPETIHDV